MKQQTSSRRARATTSATSSSCVAPSLSTWSQRCSSTVVTWSTSRSSIEIRNWQSGASIAAGSSLSARARVETIAPMAPLWLSTWPWSLAVLVV
jgi:hypothetical protein